MTTEEIIRAAQELPYEERKKIIRGLFDRMTKAERLAGSITFVGDLEAGKRAIGALVQDSIQHSIQQLNEASF